MDDNAYNDVDSVLSKRNLVNVTVDYDSIRDILIEINYRTDRLRQEFNNLKRDLPYEGILRDIVSIKELQDKQEKLISSLLGPRESGNDEFIEIVEKAVYKLHSDITKEYKKALEAEIEAVKAGSELKLRESIEEMKNEFAAKYVLNSVFAELQDSVEFIGARLKSPRKKPKDKTLKEPSLTSQILELRKRLDSVSSHLSESRQENRAFAEKHSLLEEELDKTRKELEQSRQDIVHLTKSVEEKQKEMEESFIKQAENDSSEDVDLLRTKITLIEEAMAKMQKDLVAKTPSVTYSSVSTQSEPHHTSVTNTVIPPPLIAPRELPEKEDLVNEASEVHEEVGGVVETEKRADTQVQGKLSPEPLNETHPHPHLKAEEAKDQKKAEEPEEVIEQQQMQHSPTPVEESSHTTAVFKGEVNADSPRPQRANSDNNQSVQQSSLFISRLDIMNENLSGLERRLKALEDLSKERTLTTYEHNEESIDTTTFRNGITSLRVQISGLQKHIDELVYRMGDYVTKDELGSLTVTQTSTTLEPDNGSSSAARLGYKCLTCGRPTTGVVGMITDSEVARMLGEPVSLGASRVAGGPDKFTLTYARNESPRARPRTASKAFKTLPKITRSPN